jgi:hypothetical protein
MSVYDYYFRLEEKDVDNFFQSCIADDLGHFVEEPFSRGGSPGRLDYDEVPEIEEVNDIATEEE